MPQQPENTSGLVHIHISPNDLWVVKSVLYPYAQFVKSELPPSVERGFYLMNIEILRQLITDVLAAGFIEGDTLLIRNHEAEIVDKALLCFVEMLPLVVPQSKERDETIAAVKQLREHLSPLLFTNPDTSHRN